MNAKLRSLPPLLAVTVVGLLAASCAMVTSTPMSKDYNSRNGTKSQRKKANFEQAPPVGKVDPNKKPRRGQANVTRYYLPIPYVTVRAYEVRVLGQTRLHFTTHATAVPDLAHPLLLEHDYSFAVKTALRVTTSTEGFLERVTYGREPQTAQAIAAMAKAALSVAAPVPLPFKGDLDFPEFSRLVFEKSYNLEEFTNPAPVIIGQRHFEIDLSAVGKGVAARYSGHPDDANDLLSSIPGFYYRPLIPVKVSIKQTPSGESSATPVVVAPEMATSPITVQSALTSPTTPDQSVPGPLLFKIEPHTPPSGYYPNAKLVTPETPVAIETYVYCADPRQVDAFFFTKNFLAAQDVDLKFSAGNLYEVRAKRDSDLMAVANIPLDVVGSVFGSIGGLLKVDVQHHGAGSDSVTSIIGGDKDPTRPRPPVEKD